MTRRNETTNFTQEQFDLLMRVSFLLFLKKAFSLLNPGEKLVHNWHLDAIAHHLELCMRGEIKRLIITIPPRFLKSHIATVAFPAFLLGNDPTAKIACVSYAQPLSEHFSNQRRKLIETSAFQSAFPEYSTAGMKNTSSEIVTSQNGFCLATSVGGTLTGRGADFLILDDVLKPDEAMSEIKRENTNDWFFRTARSRLNDMNEGCIIVVQQRIHENDLVGCLLEKDSSWVHLNLPAIAQKDIEIPVGNGEVYHFAEGECLHPERYGKKILNEIQGDVGSYIFSSQYLQDPIPVQGNIIPVEAFKTYQQRPKKQLGDMIVQSWDTASGANANNDYSVGTTWLWRFGQSYLLDVVRRKMGYQKLLYDVCEQANIYEADLVLIERTGVGIALIDDLKSAPRLNILEVTPTQDKVTRMLPGTAEIEAGKVAIPEEAIWLADFTKECAAFPNGKHDDQVDSMSQFLNWAREKLREGQPLETLGQTLDMLAAPKPTPTLQTKEDVKRLLWRR